MALQGLLQEASGLAEERRRGALAEDHRAARGLENQPPGLLPEALDLAPGEVQAPRQEAPRQPQLQAAGPGCPDLPFLEPAERIEGDHGHGQGEEEEEDEAALGILAGEAEVQAAGEGQGDPDEDPGEGREGPARRPPEDEAVLPGSGVEAEGHAADGLGPSRILPGPPARGQNPAVAPEELRSAWTRLGPEGFSALLAERVPYSGSVGARVEAFSADGGVRVSLEDRPELRNHLDCLHAVALLNLGELATGLSLMAALPDGARAILVDLGMQYLRKARGRIQAEAPAASVGEGDVDLEADLRDAGGDLVARARARWRVELP